VNPEFAAADLASTTRASAEGVGFDQDKPDMPPSGWITAITGEVRRVQARYRGENSQLEREFEGAVAFTSAGILVKADRGSHAQQHRPS
jgi:hypothetical protein